MSSFILELLFLFTKHFYLSNLLQSKENTSGRAYISLKHTVIPIYLGGIGLVAGAGVGVGLGALLFSYPGGNINIYLIVQQHYNYGMSVF